MKKLMFLAAVMCVFSMAAFAQKATNYAGTWTLDASKSKLDERMRNIESMTLTVEQTAAELTVTSTTKRAAPPADAQRPAGGGMGGGRGMGMFGDGKTVYALDGKETKADIDGPNGKTPQALKAKSEGGKLHLSKSMTMTTQMGEMTMTTKEVWELAADGKTLTVSREQTTPRGVSSSTMVFTKS
jgi:outer membrane lipoprotein-sorting protein